MCNRDACNYVKGALHFSISWVFGATTAYVNEAA